MIEAFVFFSAEDGKIRVSIGRYPLEEVVAFAKTSDELVKILGANEVDVYTDQMYNSSDVDFASEEGFADDKAAHRIIDEQINKILIN